MTINFFEHKRKIERSIISQLDSLNASSTPLEFAWALYGLSTDNNTPKQLISLYYEKLKSWVLSNNQIAREKDIASIAIFFYIAEKYNFSYEEKLKEKFLEYLKNQLSKLDNLLQVPRFFFINNPSFVFPIALAINMFEKKDNKLSVVTEIKNKILDKIPLIKTGSIKRQILYSATEIELNHQITYADISKLFEETSQQTKPDEVIICLWFLEKYNEIFANEKGEYVSLKEKLWMIYSKLYQSLAYPSDAGESIINHTIGYIVGDTLAFLYEALNIETKVPDPVLLFDTYPIHEKIKNSCRSYFLSNHYSEAVFEAAKILENYIKTVTGINNFFGVKLIERVIDKNNPIIQFTERKTQSEKSEHDGLRNILIGIFKAIRNPKGHDLSEKISLTAYDALDQLIMISYLLKRLENAKVNIP